MCVHPSLICGVWYRHGGREETPQSELRGLDRFVGQAGARAEGLVSRRTIRSTLTRPLVSCD